MAFSTGLLVLSLIGLVFSTSPLEDPNLFEGDIILDPDQKEAIEKGSLAYGATSGKIWPTTIPYEFSPDLRPEVIQGIYKAFEHYKKHTCIRFKKRTSTRERQYMYFLGAKKATAGGCSAHVGASGGVRNVNLGGGGCDKWNVIVHEVMHALGFWHEQSRPDRDKYIEIKWEYIPQSARINFKRYDREIDSLGVPYDFKSILHYVETAWTGGKYVSIKAKDPSQQKYIKSRKDYGLSELDIKQINLLYKCNGNKDPPPPTEPPCVDYSSTSTCRSYVKRCNEDSAIGRWLRRDCPLTCNTC